MPTFEQAIMTEARKLASLQGKRRTVRAQLRAIEADIRKVKRDLRKIVQAGTDFEARGAASKIMNSRTGE